MQLIAAIFLFLSIGTSLKAASANYSLGDSVRQLGLRSAKSQAGDPKASERYLTADGIQVLVEHSRDYITVGDIKVVIANEIGEQRGHLTISKQDYDKVFVPLFWNNPRSPVRRILLDPGHGGKDTGKVNLEHNYKEKAATLDTAARLKLLLERQGFGVFFTRTKDVFVDLGERPALAKSLRADLFISLHYNAGPPGNTSADGVETYCLTPSGQLSTNAGNSKAPTSIEPGNRFDTANIFLAWNIQRRMVLATGAEDRGVRRARFSVLRTLSCPGVLIEGGFMSNRKEGALIAQGAYRQKLAEAITAGIVDYVSQTHLKKAQ